MYETHLNTNIAERLAAMTLRTVCAPQTCVPTVIEVVADELIGVQELFGFASIFQILKRPRDSVAQ